MLTSLIIKDSQIKTTWGIASHHQNGHHQKNLQTISAGEDVEKKKSSHTVGKDVNWYSHCAEQHGVSLKS